MERLLMKRPPFGWPNKRQCIEDLICLKREITRKPYYHLTELNFGIKVLHISSCTSNASSVFLRLYILNFLFCFLMHDYVVFVQDGNKIWAENLIVFQLYFYKIAQKDCVFLC